MQTQTISEASPRESVVEERIHIDRAPAEVRAFVTTPAKWGCWHVASIAVEGDIDAPLTAGNRVTERFRMGHREGVVDWQCMVPDSLWGFAMTGTVRSGGDGFIRYRFEPEGGGTLFVRRFSYRMPNALLRLLDSLFIKRRIRRETRRSLQRLKAVLEARAVEWEGGKAGKMSN